MARPKGSTKMTPEEFNSKVHEYFTSQDKSILGIRFINEQRIFTVSGLCIFLGITRETLNEYEKNQEKGFSDTVKRAKLLIENNAEELAVSGVTNPTVTIFSLKHNFNWKDRSELDIGGSMNFSGGGLKETRETLERFKKPKE